MPTKPPKPFESDGCTLFPDGKNGRYRSCCVEHDRAYWQGGSDHDRLKADIELMVCVARKTGNTWLARMMFLGVSFGGTRWSPKLPWLVRRRLKMRHFRWGWGHDWPRSK